MSPKKAAVIGACFSLPFIITNFIVVSRVEPIYSFLGEFNLTPVFPLALLCLFPIGAVIAVLPMIKQRKFYLENTVLAALLIIVFITLGSAFVQELYNCEIAQIPNCD